MPACLRHCCYALLLAAAMAWPSAWAAAPARLADYRHDIWRAKDGVPPDIDSMAQSRDGWLWLGSSTGLYRYDGINFRKFVPAAGELLLGRGIASLAAQPNGDLWIGYGSSADVTRLRDGRLTHFMAPPGSAPGATLALAVDADASLWSAGASGLLHLEAGRWQRFGAAAGFTGRAARLVYRDRDDRLWAASNEQLFQYQRASGRFVAVGAAGVTRNLAESPDGALWQSVEGAWRRLPRAPAAAPAPARPASTAPSLRPAPARWHSASAQASLFDRDGNLWSQHDDEGDTGGLRWTAAAQARAIAPTGGAAPPGERLDQPGQLASMDVRVLLEDSEGNIWVSTRESLERFRRNQLASLAMPPGSRGFSLARGDRGGLLAVSASDGQLWRIDGDTAADADAGADADAAPRLTALGPPQGWSVAANGADGALLLAGPHGIERRDARGSSRIAAPAAGGADAAGAVIVNLVDDGEGLWVARRDRSVHRYVDGRWHSGAEYGVPLPVQFLASDGRGHTWFGYKDNRIVEFHRGAVRHYGAAQGLDLGAVTFLDASAGLLAAGSNGMALLRDGRFQRLDSDDPDLYASVSGLRLGGDGARWFNAARGVVRVSAAEWRLALAEPGSLLGYQLFDAQDGYPGANQSHLRSPSALPVGAGPLWFAAAAALVRLDPTALRRNRVAPPVHILCLNTPRRRYGPEERIRLAPRTGQFSIVYTAPSFTSPERLRFRYRLQGIDQEWQDAGTRRVAYYSNVRPGRYRFQVIAANEDGVWNSAGASLPFELEAAPMQTPWFVALCGALALALAYGLVALRMRQQQTRLRARLTLRQRERERVARHSHDTLLQNMQGWVMCAQAVANRLQDHDAERLSMEQLLRQADQALALGRDQMMEMRIAGALHTGLPSALEAAGAVLGTPNGATFSVRSSGAARTLQDCVGEEAFNLGREALANAYLHAATRVEVHLVYGAAQFELHVSDDGPCDQRATDGGASDAAPPGLARMRERSADIGGRLLARRGPGGFELVLTVPARRAYVDVAPRGLAGLLRRIKALWEGWRA